MQPSCDACSSAVASPGFSCRGQYECTCRAAHTLVLFNHADGLRNNMADTVRYHADRATEERDTLTSWNEVRKLQAGKVTRHSWNEEHPRARPFMPADALGPGEQGMHGNAIAATLDDYRVLPPRAGMDHEALCQLGMLAMQQHDYESHCFHAEGSVRDLCPGEYFTLAEHPDIDALPAAERDFVVTSLQVAAQNNLPKDCRPGGTPVCAQPLADRRRIAAARDWRRPGRWRLALAYRTDGVRRGVTIVPAYDTRTRLAASHMQSAVVVGPARGSPLRCAGPDQGALSRQRKGITSMRAARAPPTPMPIRPGCALRRAGREADRQHAAMRRPGLAPRR